MFIIWSSVIIIYNAINPQNIPIYVTLLPHSLYLWWLIRVLTIQKDKPSTERDLERVDVYSAHGAGVPYNILMPVNSQRGMFQALFTLRNPLYETRLLVSRNTIVGIAKNKFTGFAYSQTHAKSLIKKGGKIVVCKDFSQKKLDNLLGKAYIPVLRDCRKLEM